MGLTQDLKSRGQSLKEELSVLISVVQHEVSKKVKVTRRPVSSAEGGSPGPAGLHYQVLLGLTGVTQ